MAGGKWAQKIQIGVESTSGTAVPATTVLRTEGGNLEDRREVVFVPESTGIATPTNRTYIAKFEGALSVAESPATFEQLPHIFEAGVAAEVGTQDGAGSDYIYAYNSPTTTANTINTYTIETGDNQQAEEMEYAFVESFTLTGAPDTALMMSSEWIGRQVTDVSFTGALTIPAVEEIIASCGAIYINDVTSAFGTTQIASTALAFELTVTTGWKAKYSVDNGQKYFDFAYFDKDSWEVILSFTFEHNATSVLEKTDWRAETARAVQLKFEGSAAGTPGTTYSNKTLILDIAGMYETFDALSDEDGNSVITATLRAGYDSTLAASFNTIIVNELSALA